MQVNADSAEADFARTGSRLRSGAQVVAVSGKPRNHSPAVSFEYAGETRAGVKHGRKEG
jgi:hypothetical protein